VKKIPVAHMGLLWLLLLMGVVVWGQANRKDIDGLQPSAEERSRANAGCEDHRRHAAGEKSARTHAKVRQQERSRH
jgi:hypothetical protein